MSLCSSQSPPPPHRSALGFSRNHRTSAKSSLCCANPPTALPWPGGWASRQPRSPRPPLSSWVLFWGPCAPPPARGSTGHPSGGQWMAVLSHFCIWLSHSFQASNLWIQVSKSGSSKRWCQRGLSPDMGSLVAWRTQVCQDSSVWRSSNCTYFHLTFVLLRIRIFSFAFLFRL